jgi:hypothetical protein
MDAGMDRLQTGLSHAEMRMSYLARIPILGTVTGVAKIAMGTLQTLAGVGGTVVGGIARIFGNKRMLPYSLDQLKNGLGNVVAGSVEAIPLVGTAAWYVRKGIVTHKISSTIRRGTTETFEGRPKRVEGEFAPAMPAGEGVRGSDPHRLAAMRANQIFRSFQSVGQSARVIQFVHYTCLKGRVTAHKEQ